MTGMPCAELRHLPGECDIGSLCRGSHGVSAVPVDHAESRRRKFACRVDDMRQQRFASQRMQNLRQVGLHALAHAGSEYDDIHERETEKDGKFIMQKCNRFTIKRMCVALAIALLASCSVLRLGYSNAESIGYYWLNSYVDFNAEQRPWAKEQLASLFAWHRKTQLDDYIQLMTRYQEELQRPVSASKVLAEYEAVQKRLVRLADKGLPVGAEQALTMQPEQITHLEQKFASNNEKFRREYLDGDLEEQQQTRYKKVLKQAEYWFGNLSREQEAQVRIASDARPLNNEVWLAERRHRQQALIQRLKTIQAQKPPAEEVQGMLKDYVGMVINADSDPARKEFFEGSRQATAQMVASIINLATLEQRAHAAKQLQKWIDDFRELSTSQT
jgi:hypothetical protein